MTIVPTIWSNSSSRYKWNKKCVKNALQFSGSCFFATQSKRHRGNWATMNFVSLVHAPHMQYSTQVYHKGVRWKISEKERKLIFLKLPQEIRADVLFNRGIKKRRKRKKKKKNGSNWLTQMPHKITQFFSLKGNFFWSQLLADKNSFRLFLDPLFTSDLGTLTTPSMSQQQQQLLLLLKCNWNNVTPG